ncbi:MAG: DUF5615 family PIN-like protein [Candidatus Aenigmarchaeota archaeon]|nr:DUF5615 family PIN-like protein [Candidatus Aenigmarchaeota archaeon]
MKFLLDKNVHRGLSTFLSKLGHDVVLSSKGIGNSEVFKLAVEEERVLITRDSDFLYSPYTSSKHSGIIVSRIDPLNLEVQ